MSYTEYLGPMAKSWSFSLDMAICRFYNVPAHNYAKKNAQHLQMVMLHTQHEEFWQNW